MVRLNKSRGSIEFVMLDPVVKHFELIMLYWLRKGQSRPVNKPLSALRLSEGMRWRHNASALRLTACHRKITRQTQLPLLFYMLVPKVYMTTIRHRFCYLYYISGWRIKWKYIVCVLIYMYRYLASNFERFWTVSCVSVKHHICCRFRCWYNLPQYRPRSSSCMWTFLTSDKFPAEIYFCRRKLGHLMWYDHLLQDQSDHSDFFFVFELEVGREVHLESGGPPILSVCIFVQQMS